MSNVNKEMTPSGKNPFKLIFHIGAGKTGTSSIQQTLRDQEDKLKEQGIWYLGLMLEHATVHSFPWQKTAGSQDFLALDSRQRTHEALEILRETIPAIVKKGFRQAIWSNEAFFRQGGTTLIEIMRELASEGIDIRVVAYVRRHDAWARSAYVQWGLKHKTYTGPLVPFNQWVRRKPIQFYKELHSWIEAFGDNVIVRNFDAVGDTVTDFMELAGIEAEDFIKKRANETPSNEALLLRALFNEQFKGKVPLGKFDRVLGRKNVRFNRGIDDWFVEMMPSEEDLRTVADGCVDDRAALDVLLKKNNQLPIDTSPLAAKAVSVDLNKLMATVCQIVLKQAIKLEELEEKMETKNTELAQETIDTLSTGLSKKNKETNPTYSAPVFAISTGRSGSTLVQRVLNCHQDLVMWGEHFGFLNGLASTYVQMSNPKQKQFPRKKNENQGPSLLLPSLQNPAAPLEWVNPWSLEEFKVQLRGFIEGYFGGKVTGGQRWGFKEIRYNSLPVLRMLRDLYPEGKFIFIKRDPLEVTRSKVFAFVKESKWLSFSESEKSERIQNMLKEVQGHYLVYDTFMSRNPELGMVVEYEDLVAHPQKITESIMKHLVLDPERYDWDLGNQVMGSIITKTKRDDDVINLIHKVSSDMKDKQ